MNRRFLPALAITAALATFGSPAFAAQTRLETEAESREPSGCVRSFAYWNRARPQTDKALNPQTGRYVPVTREARGPDTVAADGGAVVAERYAPIGPDLETDLRYASDGRWLGLASSTQGRRRLRYVLD